MFPARPQCQRPSQCQHPSQCRHPSPVPAPGPSASTRSQCQHPVPVPAPAPGRPGVCASHLRPSPARAAVSLRSQATALTQSSRPASSTDGSRRSRATFPQPQPHETRLSSRWHAMRVGFHSVSLSPGHVTDGKPDTVASSVTPGAGAQPPGITESDTVAGFLVRQGDLERCDCAWPHQLAAAQRPRPGVARQPDAEQVPVVR